MSKQDLKTWLSSEIVIADLLAIALESVLEKGAKWVRSAGFDEAWVE